MLQVRFFISMLLIFDRVVLMISIAVCTYNGEKYIAEQLESLAGQTLRPDEVIVSDDASTDKTLHIVRVFADKAPFVVRIYSHAVRQGASLNFSEAIQACQGEYIALCDQDDVWLPEKLAKSMAVMQVLEAQKGVKCPLLVHTDLYVVDHERKMRQLSMMKAQGIYHEAEPLSAMQVLLVQNFVTGCTILLNRALCESALPIPPEVVMHDWWLALVATSMGGIGFVDEPLVLYRQHGNNVVGARTYFSWRNVLRLFALTDVRAHMRQAMIQDRKLLERLRKKNIAYDLTAQYLQLLRDEKCAAVYSLGIHHQGALRNFFFYLFLFIWHREFQNI